MDEHRKWLLHAYGGASSAHVAGQREQFFHGDEVGFLGSGGFGGFLEVYLRIAGDDTDKVSGLFPFEHEGLEHPVDVLAKLRSYMVGCEIVGVDGVGHQLVGYAGFVKQTCGIGFLNFHGSKDTQKD